MQAAQPLVAELLVRRSPPAFDRRRQSVFSLRSSIPVAAISRGGDRGGGVGGGGRLYQPFRPPSLVGTIDVEEELTILREQRGGWPEYAKSIPKLQRCGFTPPQIDEQTGITGVEQSKLVVASQVLGTLTGEEEDQGGWREYFGSSLDGAAILYELRILSAKQRQAAARYVRERRLDAKAAQEVARAVKDFDRRRRDLGWSSFSGGLPGDCLAFSLYRQSLEMKNTAERAQTLHKAASLATSDAASSLLVAALRRVSGDGEEKNEELEKLQTLRLVRLELGETAGMVVIPVAAEAAPAAIRSVQCGGALGEGPFRIHADAGGAAKGWVPLPGWQLILDAAAPLAVLMPDATLAGGRADEPMLLVIDKGCSIAASKSATYLVAESGGLALKPWSAQLDESSVLGRAIIALYPPKVNVELDESWS